MADSEDRQVVHGWSFPADLDVPEGLGEAWHRFKISGNEIKGLSRDRHIDLAHQRGADLIETEVVHADFEPDSGILHVGARAVVEIDGRRYSALQGADSASQKVREQGYTYAVAETRAIKRSVKKALNIYPVDAPTSAASEDEPVASGPGGGPDGETTVTPAPSADPEPEADPDRSVDVGDDEPDW